MSAKDMKVAGKIGHLLSRFPNEWQDYQDWLREITVSLQDLQSRYPAWLASLIFHWRLVYFAVFVGCIIVIHRLNDIFPHRHGKRQPEPLARQEALPSDCSLFILQRAATLIAVAELTLCTIAALTGIMLAFNYEPTAMGAYLSLSKIATHIPSGTLIISLHDVAGNALIILAFIQFVVLFLGRQFQRSWFIAWVTGILLTVSAIALSWTAISLKWDQIGFWRFKIELGTIASIPLIGPGLRAILTGGDGISSLTLQHMYALHSYVFAIAAISVSIIHLTSLIYQEQTQGEILEAKIGSSEGQQGDMLADP